MLLEWCKDAYNHWKENHFPGLPVDNSTRTANGMASRLVLLRKSTDLSSLAHFFHNFKVKSSDTTIFVVNGNVELAGQDTFMLSCKDWFETKKTKKP